jgi:pimeloyl-ACP methyl ester carboxylesterase
MSDSTVKKALVFVHGYLGGSPQWASQCEYFSDEFNIITPGLPGFGLNAKLEAPDTITGFAQYVLEELDNQDIGQFYLVGHSMGGMIAQEITKLAPTQVEKLVLYGTGPIGEMPGRFESIEESRNRVATDGVESTARRISAKWFIGGEKGHGYETCAEIAVLASLQAAQAGLTAMETWSGVEALPNIKAQTMVLWGDQDQSYHWPLPEKLWKEIPDASLSVVAGCSHAVHLEKPHLFNAILRDFLNA